MRIYLVRHGQSLDNVERRVQGWKGSGLTALGREQAQAAGRALAGKNISALYTSDLRRAAETAEVIAEAVRLRVRQRECFREINLGPWEGRLVSEVEASDGDALRRWREDARVPPHPGIEPVAALRDRLLQGLRTAAEECSRPFAVVSHGGAISTLLTALVGLELIHIWQMRVDNGSISVLDFTPAGFRVVSWNETLYMPVSGDGMNSI